LWIRRVERNGEEISKLLDEFAKFDEELGTICDDIGLQWPREHALPASVAEPLIASETIMDIERYLRA
jgi:hypothetical protein